MLNVFFTLVKAFLSFKEKLKSFMSIIRKEKAKDVPIYTETLAVEEASAIEKKIDMDSIRARGFFL